jgi:K+-sensing histidine kinase KdpD
VAGAPFPLQLRTPARAAAETLAYTGLAALGARLAEPLLDPQSLALFFVAPIVLAAIRFGLWASLGASLLSTLAMNFLFVEPRYTLIVARTQDAVALVLFAGVGVLASAIAAQARRSAIEAKHRAAEAELMQRYATQLAAAKDQKEIAQIAVTALSRLSGCAALLVGADGRVFGGSAGADAREAAQWAMSTKRPVLASSDEGPLTEWRFWPILRDRGAAWALGFGPALDAPPAMDAAAAQIAAHAGVALERARLSQEAEQARLEAERERFKGLLLAGVSHDLRTPLSTIVFTLQSLRRFAEAHAEETRDELLMLAEKEARRLSELVEKLLDASRIEAGAMPVRTEEVPPLQLVEQAISEVRTETPNCPIELWLESDLPPVRADPALAAHALAMVLNNAVRYANGSMQPIVVEVNVAPSEVMIDVKDRGPGLGDDPERLFGKFVRGSASDGRSPGLGLGLSIARQLIESQGGRISAANRDGGGATFSIRLPRLEAATHGD